MKGNIMYICVALLSNDLGASFMRLHVLHGKELYRQY